MCIRDSFSKGANYLAVCERVSGPEAKEAGEFAAGIRAVLNGERAQYSAEYPCDSPFEQLWFVGRVSGFPSRDRKMCIRDRPEGIRTEPLVARVALPRHSGFRCREGRGGGWLRQRGKAA